MKSCRSRSARYAGNERPAWRMNQTGVLSTAFISAAARNRWRPVIRVDPDDECSAVETATSQANTDSWLIARASSIPLAVAATHVNMGTSVCVYALETDP